MSAFYDGLAKTAANLLGTYGQSITFVRSIAGEYNPATRTATVNTITYRGRGAVLDITAQDAKGSSVQQGDAKIVLERVSTAPAVNDVATIGGVDWYVVSPAAVSPSGSAVVYSLHVRRGPGRVQV